MSDFLKDLTPAPWFDDGYRIYGPTDELDKRSGPIIAEYKHCEATKPSDGEFIAMARNAEDVMMRRRWTAWPSKHGWGVIEDEPHKLPSRMLHMYWPHPFLALVEADAWYKANVEKKQ